MHADGAVLVIKVDKDVPLLNSSFSQCLARLGRDTKISLVYVHINTGAGR